MNSNKRKQLRFFFKHFWLLWDEKLSEKMEQATCGAWQSIKKRRTRRSTS